MIQKFAIFINGQISPNFKHGELLSDQVMKMANFSIPEF